MAAIFTPPAVDGSWESFLAQALEAEGAGNDKAALHYCMQASAAAGANGAAAVAECSSFMAALADRHVQRTDAAEAARQLGNEAFSQGEYVHAEAHYTEALANTPRNALVLTNRAACALKRNDAQSALADCESALRIEPTRIKAAYRGAQALLLLQRPLGAAAMIDAALLKCSTAAERASLVELQGQVKAAMANGEAQASAMHEASEAWSSGPDESTAIATGGRDEGGSAARGVRGGVRPAASVAAEAPASIAALAKMLLNDAKVAEFQRIGHTCLNLAQALQALEQASTGEAATDATPAGPGGLTLSFGPGPLGLGLADHAGHVVVSSVDAGLPAESLGVEVGAVVCAVNGESVLGRDKRAVVALIKASERPLGLGFRTSELGGVVSTATSSSAPRMSPAEQLAQLVSQAKQLHGAGYCVGGQQNETRWRDDTACWLTAAAAAPTLPALSSAVTLLSCLAHELNERGNIREVGLAAQRGRLLRTPAACMFASYAGPGARYKPHRDNAQREPGKLQGGEPPGEPPSTLLNDRAVTMIMYLNDPAGWDEGAGGHLRIHPEAAEADDEALFASGWEGGLAGGGVAGPFADVLPIAGNCAIFRSELLHEVLPTVDGRTRLALSMWCVR